MTGKYIAYVEDDADDVLILQEVLSQEGNLAVRSFDNGSALLRYLTAIAPGDDYPCLILLDRVTYELTAQETVVLLKENPTFASIPVAILTTSASPAEAAGFARQDIQVFIKPDSVEGWNALRKELEKYCR